MYRGRLWTMRQFAGFGSAAGSDGDFGAGGSLSCGGFALVMRTAGVDKELAELAASAGLPLLVYGWLVSAFIRVATGSATVAITVAAGAPSVPDALMEQLAPGGRLVLPVGEGRETQRLLRLRKQNDGSFIREDLCSVRFVPLVGAQGWSSESTDAVMFSHRAPSCPEAVTHLLNECVEGIADI